MSDFFTTKASKSEANIPFKKITNKNKNLQETMPDGTVTALVSSSQFRVRAPRGELS
jgi:hypothetical protein